MPDPDEEMEYPKKRYQIFLKSSTGPVEVFLVSLHNQLAKSELGEATCSVALHERKTTAILSKMESGKTCAFADERNESALPAGETRKLEAGPWPQPLLETVVSSGKNFVGSAGENISNSPAILRVMPPSCDPDYWFSEEGKEFGLNDIFAPTETDGEFYKRCSLCSLLLARINLVQM